MIHRILGRALGAAAAALAVATLVAGCSVNPATGQRQLNLIGEAGEISMGREADQEISTSMGLYDAPGMQEYVQGLGTELAATSERPDLPWTFRVLDDPIVNAFALPGGFIYVTRGILSHMENEAELVSVLGHEIGHVTAQHGVNRMSKAQLLGLGVGIGMIASPEFAQFGDLVQTGFGLLFLKFSRDDERQADDLGLRYMVRGGYDARQMPGVFAMLRSVSEAAGAGRVPGWLATHPDPEAREDRIRDALPGLGADFSRAKVNREPFLKHLDGMVFGENPREGYFKESAFHHPELRFRLDFPDGWKTQNQRQAVVGVSSAEDAVVVLTLSGEADPGTAAQKFLTQEGLSGGRPQGLSIGGFPAAGGDFEVPAERPLRGQVAFVRYRDTTYRLLGYTLKEKWGDYGRPINSFIVGFREERDPAVLAVQPARLQLVRLDRATSIEEFARRYPSTAKPETLALINRVEPGGTLPAGLAKRVVGGELP